METGWVKNSYLHLLRARYLSSLLLIAVISSPPGGVIVHLLSTTESCIKNITIFIYGSSFHSLLLNRIFSFQLSLSVSIHKRFVKFNIERLELGILLPFMIWMNDVILFPEENFGKHSMNEFRIKSSMDSRINQCNFPQYFSLV